CPVSGHFLNTLVAFSCDSQWRASPRCRRPLLANWLALADDDILFGSFLFTNLLADQCFQVIDEMIVAQFAGRFSIDVHEIVGAAASKAEVGFLGFPWAIDDAADDGHIQWRPY